MLESTSINKPPCSLSPVVAADPEWLESISTAKELGRSKSGSVTLWFICNLLVGVVIPIPSLPSTNLATTEVLLSICT